MCVGGGAVDVGVAPVDAPASDPPMCLGEMEFGASGSALWTRPPEPSPQATAKRLKALREVSDGGGKARVAL